MQCQRFRGKAIFGLRVISLLAISCTLALTQTTTGSIYGTVTDQSSAAIPNAAVTVTNVLTGEAHTVQSNGSGDYVFPALAPGDYTASAKEQGFSSETQSEIRLDANRNVHVSFSLRPGATSQSITVTAATTLVDTRESQLGETVDQRRIVDLPLNGRVAYNLVQIVPGVTNYSADAITGSSGGTEFSVNGLRITFNTTYLDGAYDTNTFRDAGNLLPDPDALQEFRLLTSNFDAEFGRSPGGVVNVITASGSNRYHGLVYDYLRNNVLNARTYFVTGVTPLKQNQFGGSFGGPIIRDKAFYFLDYEGLRIRTPYTVPSASLVTPTPAEAGGNFSAANPKLWPKQANGQYYSCNGVQGVICPSLLDPVAQNFLKYVPAANPTTGITPQQVAPANTNGDQGLARIDYQLTNRQRLSGTFFASQGSVIDPTQGGSNRILDYTGSLTYNGQTNGVVNDSWVISPHALNNFNIFYTKSHEIRSNLFNSPTWTSLGSQVVPPGGSLMTQPGFTVSGYFQAGGAGPQNVSQQSIGGLETFNWTHGNHTMKAGGSFIWNKYDETSLGLDSATFSGFATGNALADLLLGRAATFSQSTPALHSFHQPSPSFFVQDDWRVTHRLTLNLGLRWETFPPLAGQNNMATFDPYVRSVRFPTAPLGMVFSGDPGVPDGILHTSMKRFAPRVGFAYDVFGNGATALRGGYGVFYATTQETTYANYQQQPFRLTVVTNDTPNLVTPYAPNPDPFPYVVNPSNPVFTSGSEVFSMPAPPEKNSATPYVQEYNLTLEQQLGSEWGMRVAYVGNVSRKFWVYRDQNSPVYRTGLNAATDLSTAALNARRPYQPTPATYTFSQIAESAPWGTGSFNSLQATLTKRFAHGFSLLASYVWEKNMDITQMDNEGPFELVNQNDPAMDYALSTLDVPQRFVASYLWAAPQVRRWGIFGRQVLSGWQLNGITTLSKGAPFTVTSGVDSNFDGNNNDRPNLVGNPVLSGQGRQAQIARFFNTAAFAKLPPNVPYGNAGRDILIGPGTVNTDFSAFKNFPVWRESTLQFRGEIFNIFDNVNLSAPTAVETSGIFGKIGSTASGAFGQPRIVQFALRYSF